MIESSVAVTKKGTEERRNHYRGHRETEVAARHGDRRWQRHRQRGGTCVPLDVKAGHVVLFGKYGGQEIKLEGEEYLIMREDEVLAVIEIG